MLTPQQIANALNTTRTEFAKIFSKAQSLINLPPEQWVEFEVTAVDEPDDKRAFEKALIHANEKGFLFLVVVVATNSGLENGVLAQFLLKQVSQSNAALQAMSNPPAGFSEPMIFSKGLLKCSQMTGKVMINGAAEGTGVLVGPNLFLTAWHVIKSMFDFGADAQGNPTYTEKVPLPSLAVEFNNMLDLVGNAVQMTGGITVNAHQSWLVIYSPCHRLELLNQIPPDPAELDRFCDYAIIRLSKTIGYERKWIELSINNIPEDNASIVLLQHPNGVPLKMDYSRVVRKLPNPPPPPYRFLHGVNALPGSSGGPCFDKEFFLIGIHQGEWPEKVNGNVTNRGVPLSPIIRHFTAKFPQLPIPDPADCPVWCIDKISYSPIIGYDDFQSDIWKIVIPGQKRIVTTAGTENSGKSLMMSIVYAILPDDDHLKITLDGEAIAEKTALEIVKLICDRVGKEVPAIASVEAFGSTRSAWLKDEVVQKLIDALNEKREKRIVWILIKDLNHISIKGEDASDFLFGLYDRINKEDWLRFLLDGMRADIPDTVKPFTIRYRTRDIQLQEIVNYLKRGFTEFNNPLDDNAISWMATFLYNQYQKELMDNPLKAMEILADDSQELLLTKIK